LLSAGDWIEQPGAYRGGNLVGVVDPVVTAELVLGEDAGKVEILQRGVENRRLGLVAKRMYK
jgi:hypothetical protein